MQATGNCWENQNTLWYFSSTLAQSAAAFEALIAVFAVFRLQANGSGVEDTFRDALAWLKIERTGSKIKLEAMEATNSKEQIENMLRDISQKNQMGNTEESAKYLKRIGELRQFHKDLVQKAGRAMKVWAFVFGCSVLLLFFPDWNNCPNLIMFGLVLMGGLVCLTVSALLKTREFIQHCLHFF